MAIQTEFIASLKTKLPAGSSFSPLLDTLNPELFESYSYRGVLDREGMHANEFDTALNLGDGVDVRTLSLARKKALTPFTPTFSPDSTELQIAYFESTSDAVKELGGGSKMEVSLTTPKFSIGPSFESSSMNRSAVSQISSHLCLYFSATYPWTVLDDPTLTAAADDVLKTQGLPGLYSLYGTHYVSAVRPYHLFAAVYSFHFESAQDQSTFTQKAGLKVGLFKVIDANVSESLNKAVTSLSSRLSIQYSEFATGAGGVQPLVSRDVPSPAPSTPAPAPGGGAPVPPTPAPGGAPPPPAIVFFNEEDLKARFKAFEEYVKAGAKPVINRLRLTTYLETFRPSKATSFSESALI